MPQPTHEGYPPIRNMLAVSQAEVGKPFTYYFGACWDRSGDFTNHVQWENYVKRFAERRDQPLSGDGWKLILDLRYTIYAAAGELKAARKSNIVNYAAGFTTRRVDRR